MPKARFCSACGAPVALTEEGAPPSSLQGERRQVSVLFADLSDYTRLSGALDPEETNVLLARYFEAVDGIVSLYGGSVLRHVGDAVLGVFGAPVAHDNDPERAVRAAVDIHAAMDRLSRETGHSLQVHAGIASGEVVAAGLGSVVYSEYTVTGDAVNLAARLCSLAGAGETMIAQSVYGVTRSLIEAAFAGEIAVKGFPHPVKAWRVTSLRPQQTGPDRLPLAGRRAEVRQFDGILAAVRESGEGQVVHIRGEPGIGKTRLAEEFTARATDAGFAVHRSLVLDFGTGRGRDPVGAMLRSLLGLSPDADDEARRAAVDRVIAAGGLDPDRRVFVYDLLDLAHPTALRALYDAMDAATRSRGREATLVALVRHASQPAPLVLLVEDLHWADAATLGQLAALANAAAGASAILVMTSRIEGDPIDAGWRSRTRDTPFTTFDLGPLRETEARALATAVADAASRFIGACLARAGGNPLFLVQLLHAAEQASIDAVPDSIQSLVLARMDRLSPADRRALQAAAVLGQSFSLEALRHLVDAPDYRCEELLRKYLIRPEGDDFLFAHALVRDGVYASLTRQARRDLHRRAAEWFGEIDLVLAAEHLDRADDAAAPQAFLRAAAAQRDRFDFDRARTLAARGLALARDPADRAALAQLHAHCLREVGHAQDSVAAFREALALTESETDRGRAWIGIAAGLRILSRLDEAMAALDEAERALAGAGLPAELGQIHFIRGNLHFARGDPASCLASHQRALALAEQAGDAQLEANALGGLGDGYYASGRMRTALVHFQRCSDLCRARGFGRIDVSTRFMIGHCLRYQNDLATGLAEHAEQAASAVRIGSRLAEMTAQQSRGILLVETGRYADAVEVLTGAKTLSGQLGTRRFDAIILAHCGVALVETGRRAEGWAAIEEGVAIARETGTGFAGPAVLGCMALYADDDSTARQTLAEAEAILARGCVGHNYFWFYRDAIEASLRARRPDEALRYAQALADYTSAEPLPWSEFYIARARALAAFARGDRSPALRAALGALRDQALAAELRPAVPLIDAALGGELPAERSARTAAAG